MGDEKNLEFGSIYSYKFNFKLVCASCELNWVYANCYVGLILF